MRKRKERRPTATARIAAESVRVAIATSPAFTTAVAAGSVILFVFTARTSVAIT